MAMRGRVDEFPIVGCYALVGTQIRILVYSFHTRFFSLALVHYGLKRRFTISAFIFWGLGDYWMLFIVERDRD